MCKAHLSGFLFVVTLCIGNVQAQQADGRTMDAPLYVIRIQQVQARQSTCILFQNDSEYHYERDTFDKIEIFEGRLDPSETPLLRNLINSETLRVLTQNKIVDSQFRAAEDEVSLALIRPEGWQTLTFPDAISRASFSRVLDPILNLLTSLGKRPHTLLDEDRSRNNCYPSGEISLKKRPTENADVAPAATHKGSVATNPEASFLLRVVSNSIDEEGVANSCVILYADGKYHWERMIQVSGRKVVTSDIFEDQVDSIALQQLPAILNDPKLWSGDQRNFLNLL